MNTTASSTPTTAQLMQSAQQAGIVVPGFNIPYLPMMAPVVQALRDCNAFGLIMVARLEWVKFESGSMKAIRDQYERDKDPLHTRLHLDHIPVIDEDQFHVPYIEEITEAINMGYESVMVDGSRLSLNDNIAATQAICEVAHAAGVSVESELGAVMGHEDGPMPPYEELFASGKGFTDPQEAKRFVEETKTDWLSVAIGSIHGAISAAKKNEKKLEARLDIAHLDRIREAIDVPFVLHGGTGIRKEYIMDSIKHGIAKINIATAIRQPYEQTIDQGVDKAQQAVYDAMLHVINNDIEIAGSAGILGLTQ